MRLSYPGEYFVKAILLRCDTSSSDQREDGHFTLAGIEKSTRIMDTLLSQECVKMLAEV